MRKSSIRVLLAAGILVVSISTSQADEIISLYNFDDMATWKNGTTRAVKQFSVGLKPKLTLVEGVLTDQPLRGTLIRYSDGGAGCGLRGSVTRVQCMSRLSDTHRKCHQ